MAFLKVPKKILLRQVEILGPVFWTSEELTDMAKLPEFYTWSGLGYYEKVLLPNMEDTPAEVLSKEDVEFCEISLH